MSFKLIEKYGAEELWGDAELSMVRMRDGVRLATAVFLPDTRARHSAVLVRTPYDIGSRYVALQQQSRYFTERGYAFVIQDVRGKFRSEGETLPYHHDVADAYDTAEWISAQAWSDRKLALLGSSYYGFTVWAGVASGHPSIRAAIPQVTMVNMGAGHIGSSWTRMVPSLTGPDDLLQIWVENESSAISVDYTRRPVTAAFDEATAVLGRCRGLEELLERSHARDWYTPFGDRHPYWSTEIPILHTVSWFDAPLSQHGIDDFRWFRGRGGRRGLHYLRAESTDHGRFHLDDVGLGPEADPYYDDEALARMLESDCAAAIDFLDVHLGHRDRDIARDRRVEWHLGHVGWRNDADWPPPGTEPRRLHLGAGMSNADGSLSANASGHPDTIRWIHDPRDPVPSSTSIDESWTLLSAYPDVRDRQARPDVLSFTSNELAESIDLVGEPVLSLTVSSSAPSTHLFAVLCDIYPDGATRQIVRGQIVHSRSDYDEQVRIELAPIGYRFQAGHRMQLQISSSDYPWFLVHPGTDENPWFAEKQQATEQTLVSGGASGASLELPVMQAG